jgi:hypothetical protein
LTNIDTLGCTSLQLPPPNILANGSRAIMSFLSFIFSGTTGDVLDLSMQQLTTLPVICANTALIALKLSGNNLKCIPVEFGRCSLLTSLEFDDSSEWLWPPPPVMVAGPAAH